MKITVDFDQTIGAIKPLHGLDNGPVCYGNLVDVTEYYKEINTPYIRLHDTNWPHPREVDIFTIFPDFDKDEMDPNSYDFRATDDYLATCLATGAQIVYRLGVSIEHTPRKYHLDPPKDYKKWARICAGIIRHYNKGWADGFHHGIKYWEIWNEPDIIHDKSPMWSGNDRQYFDLYEQTAFILKEEFPEILIGGPVCTGGDKEYVRNFLAHVKACGAPFDFFSWHTYGTHPERVIENAEIFDEILNEYGFTDVESQCNEYNLWIKTPEGLGSVFEKGDQRGAELYSKAIKDERGCAFTAGVLMALQDKRCDVLTYYDGAPTSAWSCFNQHGVPQKSFEAFRAFDKVYQLNNRSQIDVEDPMRGIYVLAAGGTCENGKKKGILLVSSFNTDNFTFEIEVKQSGNYILSGTDSVRWGEQIYQKSHAAGDVFSLTCDAYGIYMYEFCLG